MWRLWDWNQSAWPKRICKRVAINTIDYHVELAEAVMELKCHGIPVTIYNHQLCTLAPELWDKSRQSISQLEERFPAAVSGAAGSDTFLLRLLCL